MRRKFEELTDRVDGTRDIPVAVVGELRSIYDVEIYRPLPVHLARLLKQLDQVDDRARGLRAGGDDHLTGPLATVELIAGIEALLRRSAESRDTVLRVGPLELDLIERTAKRGERTIDLLPREFRLLEYMMRRKEQILTRAVLLEEVWNYKFVPQSNLVDVHMGRLRCKVDEPHEPRMIYNVRGTGFVLRAPA
jgi:two-component system OmpR family response regulator